MKQLIDTSASELEIIATALEVYANSIAAIFREAGVHWVKENIILETRVRNLSARYKYIAEEESKLDSLSDCPSARSLAYMNILDEAPKILPREKATDYEYNLDLPEAE